MTSKIAHSTFTIERRLPGSLQHAFRFWADPALKQLWTSCHPDWTMLEQTSDFRIAGQDLSRMRAPDGAVHTITTCYLDLLAPERINYAYAMRVDDIALSTSQVTVEFLAQAGGTTMLFTEQLAMLGDAADIATRKHGTDLGFKRLVDAMAQATATTH